jgi:hypothetical protein
MGEGKGVTAKIRTGKKLKRWEREKIQKIYKGSKKKVKRGNYKKKRGENGLHLATRFC